MMLHLPGPHLCPICNIVHDIRRESNLLPSVLSKLSHNGTYLPIASNGQTNPARCYGTFGSGGSTTLTVSENSISGLSVTSSGYPYSFSVGRTGWYSIGVMWQYGVNSATSGTVSINVNGSARATSNQVDTSNHDAGTGVYLEGNLNAGDSISFTSSYGTAPYTWTGINSFSIVFVPTPQNRK